jgi:hypothetical protein
MDMFFHSNRRLVWGFPKKVKEYQLPEAKWLKIMDLFPTQKKVPRELASST